MSAPLIRALRDVRAADLSIVGGKGASLGELVRAGFPVPDGFVITTDAYALAAREAGLPNDAEFRSAFGAYIEWGSRLAVENSQTDARPPEHMPMPHWDWHTAAGPPGSRVSALASPTPEAQADVVFPGEDELVSFEIHIKPLFRPMDKQSMSFAFDLWSYDDVSRRADAILALLRAGNMPCDDRWSDAKVDVFERWVESGKAP